MFHKKGLQIVICKSGQFGYAQGMMIRGARVVTPGRDLGVADVRIENGVIAEVAAKVSPTAGERVIEADGLTLLPGFVDIHSHGRGGADFCDATDAAFDILDETGATDATCRSIIRAAKKHIARRSGGAFRFDFLMFTTTRGLL